LPKSDARNNAHLIAALGGHADTSAHYCCALVLVRAPDDPCPLIAEGRWHGRIVSEPRGANGFGYDPHFLLPALGRTAAEIDAAEKNRISHRGQALAALIALLREERESAP
jgi:XTP/dITP diphosphohydrolase